jgi:hypothetical protein
MPNVPQTGHLTCTLLFILAAATPLAASAQDYSWFGRIDTVTSGPGQDYEPALFQKIYSFASEPGPVWMVFVRQTPDESQILAKSFDYSTSKWDSAASIISHAPASEMASHPDYTESPRYFNSDGQRTGLAVWQQWKNQRWQIFYSFLVDSQRTWTLPALLVADSVDLTYPRALPLADTTFLVTYRRLNAVLETRVSLTTVTPPKLLAISSSDTIQYDIGNPIGNEIQLLWTSGPPEDVMILKKHTTPYAETAWSNPETCLVHLSCMPNPHFFIGLGSTMFFYEQDDSQQREVMMAATPYWPQSTQVWNVSEDPGAMDVNAQGFMQPVITKRFAKSQRNTPWLDVCVYEKYHENDSAMVFISYGRSDTVRTEGHNRNACVGSRLWYSFDRFSLLIVWESNRSGISHIFSRVVSLRSLGVEEPATSPGSFELKQNYPNPFNAGTVIEYRVQPARLTESSEAGGGSGSREVRLAVYDLLGREVATLQDGQQGAGIYRVEFDGTKLSSGVYIYRMTVGSLMQARAMVLLR